MSETFISKYYKNDKQTLLFKIITGFALGLIFSPFSNGLFFIIIFYLICEILYYLFTHGDERYWNSIHVPIVLFFYILGWLIGRLLSVPWDNILDDGIPNIEDIQIF